MAVSYTHLDVYKRQLSPLAAYLDIERIVSLAKKKKVDAIHPGYGFLSENPQFSKACADAGIVFIGPPAEVLDRVGDKINAKKVAKECGVPTIPGSAAPLQSAGEAARLAEEFGYPVILKASAAVSYTHLDVYKRQVLK